MDCKKEIRECYATVLPNLRWCFWDCLVKGIIQLICKGLYGVIKGIFIFSTLVAKCFRGHEDKVNLCRTLVGTCLTGIIFVLSQYYVTIFCEFLIVYLIECVNTSGVSEGWISTIKVVIYLTLYSLLHLIRWIYVNAANFYWWKQISEQSKMYDKVKPPSGNFLHYVADYGATIVLHFFLNLEGAILSLFIPYLTIIGFYPLYLFVKTLLVLLSTTYFATTHSLYAFDYRWDISRTHIGDRLKLTLKSWPYFLGFGLPVTLVQSLCASWYPSVPPSVQSDLEDSSYLPLLYFLQLSHPLNMVIVGVFYPFMILGAGKFPDQELPKCLQINIFWLVEWKLDLINGQLKKIEFDKIENKFVRTLLLMNYWAPNDESPSPAPKTFPQPDASLWKFSDTGRMSPSCSSSDVRRSVQNTPYVSRSTPARPAIVNNPVRTRRRRAGGDAPVFEKSFQ